MRRTPSGPLPPASGHRTEGCCQTQCQQEDQNVNQFGSWPLLTTAIDELCGQVIAHLSATFAASLAVARSPLAWGLPPDRSSRPA